MIELVNIVYGALKGKKLFLNDEKVLQLEIYQLLAGPAGAQLEREKHLSEKNIIDFFIDGLGIEVKIKGSRKQIYRQCERYCQFQEVKALILITNVSMGFPEQINGKDCYILNLGKAWL